MCIARTELIRQLADYFFLCLFFLKRFLRLWVAIFCFFLFFPLGIVFKFFIPTRPGLLNDYFRSFK
jgi:hypothetical protein